jgi:hypothetical protein
MRAILKEIDVVTEVGISEAQAMRDMRKRDLPYLREKLAEIRELKRREAETKGIASRVKSFFKSGTALSSGARFAP